MKIIKLLATLYDWTAQIWFAATLIWIALFLLFGGHFLLELNIFN